MRDARSKTDCGLQPSRFREHATGPVPQAGLFSRMRCHFHKQGYPAGNDHQAEERCHDEVDKVLDKVLHDVPPLPAGRRHPERSVERAARYSP